VSSVAKPSRSTFHLYDRILDGTLGETLLTWRAEDPPASYTEIVVRLRGLGVDVSQETVRRWMALIDTPVGVG
jgi:hypothetical protein